jgi:hypothetical protein
MFEGEARPWRDRILHVVDDMMMGAEGVPLALA